MRISQSRWQEAQAIEISMHESSPEIRAKYQRGYDIVFDLLGGAPTAEEFSSRKILEVGPAFYPAVSYYPIRQRHVVEPLYQKFPESIKQEYRIFNIKIWTTPMELTTFEDNEYDEVWCFNLLQHVFDPAQTLQKCLHAGKTLRLFEPIDYPIEPCHPHAFTADWFRNQLPGEKIGIYPGGSISQFHTANCVHATITKPLMTSPGL